MSRDNSVGFKIFRSLKFLREINLPSKMADSEDFNFAKILNLIDRKILYFSTLCSVYCE